MKILKILFLISLLISCKSNPINPELANTNELYTKEELSLIEEIDSKYPYFKVDIERFKVNIDAPLDTIITVEDKVYALEALALMRIGVNILEFETELKKLNLISSREDSYPNSEYNIKVGDKYDNDRVIEVIRSANYKVVYLKSGREDTVFMGDIGESSYVRYGYKDNLEYGTNIYLPNRPWNSAVGTVNRFSFTSVLFHEHLHNLGFDHRNGYNMIEVIQQIFQNNVLRVIFRTGKYAIDLEKMKQYYKIKNKKWLDGDTVVPPEEYPK